MEEKTKQEELEKMKVGECIKWDIFDVWRVPTGWLFGIDNGAGSLLAFVPDVLTVELNTNTK